MSNATNTTAAVFPPSKSFQCSQPTYTQFYFHAAFLMFILLVTFFGNMMVVLAVVLFHRMRTITNYFVVSLAMSDLLVACLSLPFRLHQTMHNLSWCWSLEACVAWIVVDTTCSGASIWNLAMISIDRFIAIVLPFRYHSLMTQRTGFSLMAATWGIASLTALLSLTNWTFPGKPHFDVVIQCAKKDRNYYTVVTIVGFFLPLLVVLIMYGGVFNVAINQARAVAALQTDSHRRGRRSSINLVREVKAAKILAIVIGCFVVCWLPFFVLTIVSLWNPTLLSKKFVSRKAAQGITLTFIYILPLLNSTMNPVIYALFNKDFRYAFRKLFLRITGNRLGGVGMNDTLTMSIANDNDGRTVTSAPKLRNPKLIRFQEADSESSDAVPPTIPIRDPRVFENEGCEAEKSSYSDNVFHSNGTAGVAREEAGTPNADYSTPPNIPDDTDVSSDPDMGRKAVRLSPLQRGSRDTSDGAEDIVIPNSSWGLNGGSEVKELKPRALPPIEGKERKVSPSAIDMENNAGASEFWK